MGTRHTVQSPRGGPTSTIRCGCGCGCEIIIGGTVATKVVTHDVAPVAPILGMRDGEHSVVVLILRRVQQLIRSGQCGYGSKRGNHFILRHLRRRHRRRVGRRTVEGWNVRAVAGKGDRVWFSKHDHSTVGLHPFRAAHGLSDVKLVTTRLPCIKPHCKQTAASPPSPTVHVMFPLQLVAYISPCRATTNVGAPAPGPGLARKAVQHE